MPALLLEIGTEEIPAGMIAAAQAELETRVRELMTRERLAAGDFSVKSFSTPRRLAVLAEGVLPAQADMEEQVVGPAVKVAYKDGAPTPAAMAFAKKSGVEVSELRTIENAKGEYVTATVRRPGRGVDEVLASLLPAEISGIYWPKNMYWRAGKPERFVRPVRWLVALLDEEVLPLEFAGVWASNESYGHRVLHGDAPVRVRSPRDYAEKLRASYVEVDPGVRRQRIRKALDAATRQIPGARWREDEVLVEVVTQLTEWPSVILGSFDPLGLPKEVLITVMRDHQKYFALEDTDGKLLPNFLAVLNIKVDEAGAAIIRHGNERVLRARFNDARFFWDVDQKIPLVDRVEMLKSVTFQKDLGSYWDKTERNRAVARSIIDRFDPPLFDSETVKLETFRTGVDQAARLAKVDLTTEMVKEFTELQGVVGGLYARAQRLPDGVARAIYDHYRPMSQEDTIPRLLAGSVVALADKISTIVDMFRIGLQPTGSKDPFALRRSGNGVIRILAEDKVLGSRLDLVGVVEAAFSPNAIDNGLNENVMSFMLDRLESYLREPRGVRLQVARAVRNSTVAHNRRGPEFRFFGADDFRFVGYGKIAEFASVLNAEIGSREIHAIAELLKRTVNILRQAKERNIVYGKGWYIESHQEQPQEVELRLKTREMQRAIQDNYCTGKYKEVITAIASFQPVLDAFFDSVMVMVDDPVIRSNRLTLLANAEFVVRWAADFSELASIQQTA